MRPVRPYECIAQWYSQSPGHQESDAFFRSFSTWEPENQPFFTESTQFWYTDLPLVAGPMAVKVATDCRTARHSQGRQDGWAGF